MCAGKFTVSGHGSVSLTNAGANTPGEEVGITALLPPNQVVAHLGARTYFSDSCTEGFYSNTKYSAMKLLGKRLSFTTDVSSAGCGCNAAFYLVSMRQNPEVSSCSDYYCDANKVCGVPCAEVDIMEASKHAWHSTLHASTDSGGLGGGYGGGATWNGPRDFSAAQYGPHSTCIDTLQPVDVQVEFPMAAGQLQAMVVTLNQKGRNCPLKINLANYPRMGEISAALAAGMTPVISYWKSADMLWMDGKGADGQGPCAVDAQRCGQSAKFYDFKVEELPGAATPRPIGPLPSPGPDGKRCTPWGKDCRKSLCCLDETSTCYEKNQWWASCKKKCAPGIDPFDTPENQQPWSCKVLGGPAKPSEAPKPPATKIVVLRVPVRDVWPGLADGSTVTLSVGDHHVKAEVVSVKASDGGQEGQPAPGNFNATAFGVTLLVLACVVATAALFVHCRSNPREDITAMTERAVQVSRDTGRSAMESFHSWTQGPGRRPNPPSPRTAAEPPRSFMQNLSAWFQQLGTAGTSGSSNADANSRPPHRPMRPVEQQNFLW